MTDNKAIWKQVETTDPNYTKSFNRSGGFKGTATNATYLAEKATEVFGPCGIGWGMTVLKEEYVKGHPIIIDNRIMGHALTHVVHAKLWYVHDGIRGEIEQFGQTEMVGRRANGAWFTDEEAPKKSLTDAMTKCMSLLGFSADIHKGLYDDNKYVAGLREEFGEGKQQQEPPPQQEPRRQPQRDAGPRLSVAAHTKAIMSADNVPALKAAFALAWKQNEKPGDPKAHTPAQLRLKEMYDARMAVLNDSPETPADQPEPATTSDEFDLR